MKPYERRKSALCDSVDDREDITPRYASRRRTDAVDFPLGEVSEIVRFIEIENRMVVARG